MKKLLSGIVVSLAAVLMLTSTPRAEENFVEMTKKVSPLPSSKINLSMDVANPYGELSILTFVDKDITKAWMKLFSGITATDVTNFQNDFVVLKEIYGITDVVVTINSPGGNAFAGLALSDAILYARKNLGMDIKAHASGIVASATVPVFASCAYRVASPNTIFMVHEASLWKWPGRETASDIRSQNELLQLLQNRYIGILVDNSTEFAKDSKEYKEIYEKWVDMELRTTWFDAKKAKELGIVDEIK